MSKPLFEKRHYEWLAKVAGEVMNDWQRNIFADCLTGTNPNYNREKFLKAAEIVTKELCTKHGLTFGAGGFEWAEPRQTVNRRMRLAGGKSSLENNHEN